MAEDQATTTTQGEPAYNYTPDYKESHIAHHTWRTAENSAAYLIPVIQAMALKTPKLKLLDCGAGPGTLTASFSKYMPEGTLVATDLSEEVISQAKAHAESQNIKNMTCQIADIYHLDQTFPDGEFDIVHTHQTLCHLSHPLLAMRSLLRACKSGGVVAIRESDMRMWGFYPESLGLEKFRQLMMRCMDSPTVGSKLVSLAMEAGIPRANITASMGTWCYSAPEERKVFGGAMAERARSGRHREQSVQNGWNSYAEMDEMAKAWDEWVEAADGSYGSMHGEILIRKP